MHLQTLLFGAWQRLPSPARLPTSRPLRPARRSTPSATTICSASTASRVGCLLTARTRRSQAAQGERREGWASAGWQATSSVRRTRPTQARSATASSGCSHCAAPGSRGRHSTRPRRGYGRSCSSGPTSLPRAACCPSTRRRSRHPRTCTRCRAAMRSLRWPITASPPGSSPSRRRTRQRSCGCRARRGCTT